MGKHFLIITLIFIISFEIGCRAEPLVEIDQGLLEGTTFTSRNGRNFSSFLGIPYAQPPIGLLRFASPLPPKKWEGIYSVKKEAMRCARLPDNGMRVGEEDCLFLNVFTPKLKFDNSNNETLLPVIVYFHGGGFHVGSSALKYYGPHYIMDKDVVFVTLNYRLGLLGFLSTGDEVAPGNFGLKDQQLALKWLQTNIHHFGGNPSRVTIFGESAGGASVSFHALSDKSVGLFHQYIAHSGNALVPWGFIERNDMKSNTNLVAKKVGCLVTNSEILIECLRSKDFFELVNLTSYDSLDFPNVLWLPTNEVESKDAFLTDTPENLINQNKLRDYPSISGAVLDEGLYVTGAYYANETSRPIEDAIEKSINATFHRLRQKNLSKFERNIKNYYFNGSVSSNNNMILENFTKFATDSGFIYPTVILTEKLRKIEKSPVYFFLFSYRGETTRFNLQHGTNENVGVSHADELLYLFSGNHPKFTSEADNYIIDVMIDLWTSFAINGTPTSKLLENPNLWRSYQENNRFLLIGDINNTSLPLFTMQENYLSDRMDFWKNNVPLIEL